MDLPLVPLTPDRAIALLMTIDMGINFMAHAGQALAGALRPLAPEVVVSTATLGIPVAIETSRALGIDRYIILQKSPKVHLIDALAQPVRSITSRGEQRLLLDRRHVPLLAGRRVAVVDDVVASGGTLRAALALVRAAGADVVGIGVILTEGWEWVTALGRDREQIRSLGHIPQFSRCPSGWAPIPETQWQR